MADAPYWTGMTEADQQNWQNYDPRFVETMMANSAAGTLPQSSQIEAARQESAGVFNTPYTPTTYAAPPQQQTDAPWWAKPMTVGGVQGIPMPRGGFNNRGNDAVNMDLYGGQAAYGGPLMDWTGGGQMYGGTQQMYGQQPYGQSYGMSDPFGFGMIDFGYGGGQPYGGTMGYGQQQGALQQPYGDQSRGAFQFARGGRVR